MSRSWAVFQTSGPSTRIVTFLGIVSDCWPVDQNCHVLGLCLRLLARRPELSRSWAVFQTADPSTRIVTFLGCVSDCWPVDQNCHVLGLCFRLLARRPLSYSCKNIRVLKNRVEGAWRYCNDGVYVVTKPCLVYSFG